MAEKGVLDLRSWDFAKDGPVNLNGEWEFYWKKLLSPDTTQQEKKDSVSGYMQVPVRWNDFKINGKDVGSHGYATYALKILLPENNNFKILKLSGDRDSAVKIYLNDLFLMEDGKTGTDVQSSIPHDLPIYSAPLLLKNEINLLVNVSNFHHRNGGFTMYLRLGNIENILKEKDQAEIVDILLFGILFAFGLYHITLYFFRKEDISPLYFGIFCVLVAIRTLVTGQRFLVESFPDVPWKIYFSVEYAGYYLTVPFFTLFVHSIYPEEMSKKITRIIVIIAMFFLLPVILLQSDVLSRTLLSYHVFTITTGLYILYVIMLAKINKKDGALMFFAGSMFIFTTFVNDVLHSLKIINTFIVIQGGIIVFVFTHTAVLAKRFTRAFHTVETLSSELEKRNEHLENLDKLKDEFLSNTSHELRTPLNGIIGLADSLLQGAGGDLNKKVSGNLQMIATSGKRLANLINDILDYSKLKSHEITLSLKAVKIHDLVEFIISVNRILVQNRELTLENLVAKDLPAVYADEHRLEQILQNLIGNAIKFTERGKISVSAKEKNGMIEITVSDTGIGIPQNKKEDIFKSFEQADSSVERKYGGTGLGLSISKRLAELHGGSISVDSIEGKGSSFHVLLPKSPDDAEFADVISRIYTVEPARESYLEIAKQTRPELDQERKILVVDDEAVNRHVLRDLLELQGFTVSEAEDGMHALQYLENNKPDLVILDIMMPGMNGFDVCRRIREKYSTLELPILFLTAKNLVNDLLLALQAGGNDFLAKPFSSPELTARIGSLINIAASHKNEVQLKEQIQEKERLADIGMMTAGIVHDFKNPLFTIREFARMIMEDPNDKDARSLIEWIYNDSSRTLIMAQDILDFSQTKIQIRKESVKSSDFIKKVIDSVYPYVLRKKSQIQYQDNYTGEIQIDPDRLLRVFINIIDNALGSKSSGVSIDVTVDKKGDNIVISVKDNGPGIPEKIRDSLFTVFVTSGKKGGTGLGLAISKSIVEAHGGTITFESEAGKGTTFYIALPV